jgi:hypothetical protein
LLEQHVSLGIPAALLSGLDKSTTSIFLQLTLHRSDSTGPAVSKFQARKLPRDNVAMMRDLALHLGELSALQSPASLAARPPCLPMPQASTRSRGTVSH